MQYDLEGKVVIVTGAASGMGREAALRLGQEGAKVVAADLNTEEGERVAAAIRGAGGEAHFVTTDVSRSEDCERLVNESVRTFGRLDLAYNNAGIAPPQHHPLAEWDESAFDRVIAINLKSVFLCLKYEIAAMLKTGGGAIVNTASTAGLAGMAGIGIYSASKHGVVGLTRSAALDYAKQGIRINALCPGVTDTALLQAFGDFDSSAISPMGRLGTPAEVVSAALYLLSPAASFITGATFAVDGGQTAA